MLLTGGSAFGLAAATGVIRFLAERGAGFEIGPGAHSDRCGSGRFDLLVGDANARPDEAAGYAACEAAGDGPVAEGSVGAGTGASVGKFFGTEHAVKGGVGTAGDDVAGGVA